VVVEIYGTRPLAAGTRTVRLEPRWDPPRLGETELSVDLSAGWQLVGSHQGSGPEGTLTRFLFDGPPASVAAGPSATFVLRALDAPPKRRTGTFLAGGVAALAGVALALELRRRQRGR